MRDLVGEIYAACGPGRFGVSSFAPGSCILGNSSDA